MNKKDFIESKSIELASGLLGNIEYGDSRDNKEWRKKVIEFAKNIISASLNEAWEKGYEDGLSLRMNYNDPAMMERVRQQEREELIKWCEEMPTEFPERESDEYDTAYKDAKEYILNHLQELTK